MGEILAESLVLPVPVTPPQASEYETRTIELAGGESRQFQFLVIDSAEKWKAASDRNLVYEMPIVGSNQNIAIPLRGISLEEWTQMEIDLPLPEEVEDRDNQQAIRDFNNKKEEAELTRRIRIFELSTGKTIPGTDAEAKARFLRERNPGEIDAIFSYIQYDACAMRDGSMLRTYNTASSEAVINSKVIDFKDFSDWQTAAKSKYYFRRSRPGDDFIIEFPLRGVSRDRKKEIESETETPQAPRIAKRDPKTRKFDPNNLQPNYNDAGFLRKLRAVGQLRTAMYFSECLPFEIPGMNLQEKYNWIAKRLVGDTISLNKFIEDQLIGFESRYDLFTRG